jgi:paraquat-inducible protein B
VNPRAWRVGLFAVVGTIVLAAVLVLLGGQWFVRTEPAQMRFAVSVWGLQPGAPVVFRGVRVGQVSGIGLAPPGPQGPLLPVRVELDRELLQGLLPEPLPSGEPVVPALVARGLVARLALQSLLTGLLYVELDLKPRAGDSPSGSASGNGIVADATTGSSAGGLPVIPTEPTRLQSLQAQLEGFDVAGLGADLRDVAASLRALLADPRARQSLARASDAAVALQSLASRLERELPPLLGQAREAIGDGRQVIREGRQAITGQVVPDWQRALGAIASAAAEFEALVQAARPAAAGARDAFAEAGTAAAELQRAASALRQAADEEGNLRVGAERAFEDVSRAARALRELAELLERQPDALLRGRRSPAPALPSEPAAR